MITRRGSWVAVTGLACSIVLAQAWRAEGQNGAGMLRRPGAATATKPSSNTKLPIPNANQADSNSNPQAAAPAQRTPEQAAKAAAEERAAFLKLIGANWIWSPAQKKDEVPIGDCYFRKSFTVNQTDFAQVHIACDNQYELYVNGRLVGRGGDWRNMDVHDINSFMAPGSNVVAVKATNTDAGAAGLVARVIVKERGGTHQSFSTDTSWKTSVKEQADWAQPRLRDHDWLAAKVYGQLGTVLPWGDEVVIGEEGSRFTTDPEFVVERLVADEQAGSLIAMAFNASGDILASREGGSLLLIRDQDKNGSFESVTPFSNDVKNVQGILSLGNRVYAVGDGPEGGALYQLTDHDNDGRCDTHKTLVKYRGLIGEHGPHTVRLGPDGLLYVLCGNFAQVATSIDARSPYVTTYEGDLIQPRYEDPNGHAVGVPAPGGSFIRTDTNASFVEMVAGGFRNPYDFTFNSDGELFTYDADMEWDIGSPWYRPTRVVHVTPGGEYGWRSGWAKWPAYFLDGLPPAADIGLGSPTGVVYYNHNAYPPRLQNTLFVADWALGQIHAVKLERSGATYKATAATFLKGRPLNVTGLDVGPDGFLYFSTGGRGTDGGIYRVRWVGTGPPQDINFNQGLRAALDQPQLQSDWARARIAAVRKSLGDAWKTELEKLLAEKNSPARDRLRAIELLTYFGPAPSSTLLIQLTTDPDPALRARAARLIGNRSEADLGKPLVALLKDADPWVRRVACEAIAHRGTESAAPRLIELLGDNDRFVAFAARRALEKRPAAEWQSQVLAAEAPQVFLTGATGLLVQSPSKPLAQQVLERCESMLRGQVREPSLKPGQLSDESFLGLLRVVQLAYIRGPIAPGEVPTLTQQLLREFPTRNTMMNRELVRLLAYLQPPGAAHTLAHQLETNIPNEEKLHIAAYAQRIANGWETADKFLMLRYLEDVRNTEGGHSLNGYVEYFARDFFSKLTLADRRQIVAAGENYPTSALSVLAGLPENPGTELLAEIRALDQRLTGKPGEPLSRLRVGIVAVLGRSGEADSLRYLHQLYYNDPERRAPVAMSLTQHPEGESWPILVDSLRTVDGDAAREIVTALNRVECRPETSEPYRNAILLGLRLQGNGGDLVARLLERWVGQQPYAANANEADQLKAWQAWYASTFPNERPAELPKEAQPNKWSYEELLAFLESPQGKLGSPNRGSQVFKEGQCASCHRFRGQGESIGPDLTAVAQRFQRKEILESIVYPNQVVSDQYASQVVTAGGKTYVGIVAKAADGSLTILQSDANKVQLRADEVEDVQPSKTSAMPEGLANRLTLEQMADLFALLTNAPEPNIATRPATGTR
ncbi:MAG: HEAT repeat domain-containing protein [Pirellulales bacterium]|nr:HEAT repeat domain-containing protein [Pirellulales bacterium]